LTSDDTAIVRLLYDEAFNKGNVAIVDEILARTFVDHNPVVGQAPTREGYKSTISQLHASAPKWHFTIVQITRTRDLVVASITARPVRHAASDREIAAEPQTLRGAVLYRVVNGKITDRWGAMGPMQQLGMLSAPPGTAGEEDSVYVL